MTVTENGFGDSSPRAQHSAEHVKIAKNWLFLVFLILATTGITLRLWHWSDQILLDDEWHALNFVFNRSFFDVIMQQGLGANSIPVNIHSWIILNTLGWSEPLLRLPSMAAGIIALIVIPMLVRRIWGDAVACITAALLAVSPVVIFYCRIMRPYAPVMLLAVSSVLLTLAWMKEGRRRDLVLSALCGSFAIYYHLYAAIPVGMPFIIALAASLKPIGPRLGLTLTSKTPLTDILTAGGIMAILDGVLVVIPNVLNPWWSHGIHGVDHADLQTVITVSSLISGSGNHLLMITVIGLLLIGFAVIIRGSRIAGVSIAASFLLFTLVMAKTTQEGAHAGIQVARYGITFLPLSFVVIAVALAWIGNQLSTKFKTFHSKPLLFSIAVVAWLPYLATSPLWTTYSAPNNFTSHSAYQYRYEPIKWQEKSRERDLAPGISMAFQDIPPFYLKSPLLKSAKGIIEYPMLIGDQLNIYYYYQHFHQLPVVAGFVSNNIYAPVKPGRDFVYGNWSIDSVMTAMPLPARNKTSWHTMADLNNSSELRNKFRGWIVIIHRDPEGEINASDPESNRMSVTMADVMTKNFGNSRFMDGQLAAWLIE